MNNRLYAALAFGLLLSSLLRMDARSQDHDFTLIARGNLTTSTQLFPNPNSSDAVARAQSYDLQNFFGYGFEVRYQFPGSNVALGISSDYIHTSQSRTIDIAFQQGVPVDDGYRVIPVELTGYFLIPASGPNFGVFMGGGAGIYFGERTYTMAGTEARLVNTQPGLGIHVLGGVSYRFGNWFSLLAEMKFRDLQFKSSNAFSVSRIIYHGAVLNTSSEPFESTVHTDGIVFQLGAAVNF